VISLVVLAALATPARTAAQRPQQDAMRPSARTCNELELQRRLAAEPARTQLEDVRISIVLPPGLRRLTADEIAMGLAPPDADYAFVGSVSGVYFRLMANDAAEVDSAAFRQRWESWLVRNAGTPAIEWISRGVVARSGARWLALDLAFTRPGQARARHSVHLTSFRGGTLAAGFLGPADTPSDTALDSSLASLQVENCDLVTPVEMLVDSTALARAVSTIPAPRLPAGLRPIFMLTFDSTGGIETAEPLFDSIPPAYAAPVVAALRASVRRQLSRGVARAYLVRVVAGPMPLIDVPRVKHTPPVGDMRALRRSLDGLATRVGRHRETRGMSALGVMVRMRVLADGSIEPGSLQLTKSSGVGWVDAGVLERVEKLRFSPGEVDEVPIKEWVALPIILRPHG
jgi:hypothetical protein